MSAYTLELADAHEFLRSLPDASVDAVIADPPYSMTALAYEQPVDWPTFWREAYRVAKPAAQMVFFTAQPFTTLLINSNPRDFRLERIWVKSRKTGHLNSKWRPLQQHENILVFCREPMRATYNPQKTTGHRVGRYGPRRTHSAHYGKQAEQESRSDMTRQPTTVMTYDSVRRNDGTHPSQKSLPLLEELCLTYSNPNDLVLDPYSGSGTTAHACLLTGRNFTGCEIDPGYHHTAIRRLEAVQAQASMFAEAPA